MSNDYGSHLDKLKRVRLERIAVALIAGMLADSRVLKDGKTNDLGIKLAKDLMEKIDKEEF